MVSIRHGWVVGYLVLESLANNFRDAVRPSTFGVLLFQPQLAMGRLVTLPVTVCALTHADPGYIANLLYPPLKPRTICCNESPCVHLDCHCQQETL